MLQVSPTEKISNHFTYREALFLPSWGRLADESDGVTDQTLENLKAMFAKMDLVRDFFGLPIRVHVALRPPAYNKLVGGAADSAHQAQLPLVAAVDFDVEGVTCDDVRAKLMSKLDEWGLRMEDRPGSNWVHLDNKTPAPGGHRFFKP